MSIQGSINSMIGSASHVVGMVKGYQALKNKEAEKQAKVAAKTATKQPQITMEQANGMMQQKAQQQVKQRRNFNEYLQQIPTSFGGTVGDLPPAMQTEIAKNYTKSQRRTIMDRMDKENK